MKKRQRSVVLAAISILALVLLVQSVSAQESGGRRRGRRAAQDPQKMLKGTDEGENKEEKAEATSDEPRPDRRRRFDRGRIHERMMDHIKESLGSTDEEWNAIKPLVEKAIDARMESRIGGFRGWRRGPESDMAPEAEALVNALDSGKSTPEEIKQKLEAFRQMQKKKEQELAKAREDLRKVLTVKQEAQLVLMGILD